MSAAESFDVIVKRPGELRLPPNLGDYEQARRSFSWEQARRELAGLPGGVRPGELVTGGRAAAGKERGNERC